MRILMLHGYAQNATIFQHKCRQLQDCIRATYPEVTFSWLNAPFALRTYDIPGCTQTENDSRCEDAVDLRGWFDLRDTNKPPAGLHRSMCLIAQTLEAEGPFQGIIAFSQGTTVATVAASLLEGSRRRRAYRTARRRNHNIMRYPPAFLTLNHPPLQFAILYATRLGDGDFYHWLYDCPAIRTPMCNVIGKWDPMIEHEQRCQVQRLLAVSCLSRSIVHNGAHFVPKDSASLSIILEFLSKVIEVSS
jgi:hypothetical protein